MLGFLGVCGQHLVLSFLHRARDQAISAKGLKFDKIRPSLCSDINQVPGQVKVAVMVYADLGNDEGSLYHN